MPEFSEGYKPPTPKDNVKQPMEEKNPPVKEGLVKRALKAATTMMRRQQQDRPTPKDTSPVLTPEEERDKLIPYKPYPRAKEDEIDPDILELNNLFQERFENSAIKIKGKFTKQESIQRHHKGGWEDGHQNNQWELNLPDGTHWQVIDTPPSDIMILRQKGDFGEWVRFNNLFNGSFSVEYTGGMESKDNPFQDLDTSLKSDLEVHAGYTRDNEVAVEMARKVIKAMPQVEKDTPSPSQNEKR